MMALRRLGRLATALIVCALVAYAGLGADHDRQRRRHGEGRPGRRRPWRDRGAGQRNQGNQVGARGHERDRRLHFPNVTADTYTVEVTMEGFKTLTRQHVRVSGGDRVAIPPLTIEVGGAAETVNVSAEAALVQSQSGERSFAVTTEQIGNLPIDHGELHQPDRVRAWCGQRRRVGRRHAARRRQPEQHHDGRRLGHGYGQQRPDDQHEHRVHRRGQGPHPGLPGRVRAIERPADHRRDQERHEPVPRIGLRRPDRLRLERELLGA